MHISDGILEPQWVLFWFAISALFIALGLRIINERIKEDPSYLPRISLIGAVVFVISVWHIPVPVTEFFFYVLDQGAPVIVRLPLIFFHAASASIIAYGIATKKPVRYYMLAVFLHLANNIFTFSEPLWLIGGPADLIITYYLSWHLYKKTSERFY